MDMYGHVSRTAPLLEKTHEEKHTLNRKDILKGPQVKSMINDSQGNSVPLVTLCVKDTHMSHSLPVRRLNANRSATSARWLRPLVSSLLGLAKAHRRS